MVSTGCHRKTCGEYVTSGVVIAVMQDSTALAAPCADAERQILEHEAANRAGLAARKEPVDLCQAPSIPCTLVGELAHELTPTRAGDCARQTTVLDHILDAQVLNHDRLVFANELSRELVNKVLSLVGDFGVEFCDSLPRFLAILGAFDLARESLLGSLERREGSVEPTRIVSVFTGRECGEAVEPEVNPDGMLKGIESLERLDDIFNQKADVPATRRVEGHGDRAWLSVLWKGPRPPNVERFLQLGKGELVLAPGEAVARELRFASVTTLFELGIASFLLEEASEVLMEVTECLLEGNFTWLPQKSELFLLLPLSEPGALLSVTKSAVLVFPCFLAISESLVVNQTNTAEGLAKQGLLLGCGIEAISIASLDHRPEKQQDLT